MPAQPEADALKRFHEHEAIRKLARTRSPSVGWCLGHIRTFALEADSYRMIRSWDWPAHEDGSLINAAEFLSTPIGCRLEELRVSGTPSDIGTKAWRRLVGALPAGCTALSLGLPARGELTPDLAQRILDAIPPVVRTLRLSSLRPELFVDDRFDELRVAEVFDVPAMIEALSKTKRVRLRIGAASTRAGFAAFPTRVPIGDEGAALLSGSEGAVMTLPPASLLALQRRYGLVPIRTQLARVLSEPTTFQRVAAGRIRVKPGAPPHIVRHGDGRFTLRSYYDGDDDAVAIVHNGVALTNQPVPLVDGDRLIIEETEWTFSTTGGGRAP